MLITEIKDGPLAKTEDVCFKKWGVGIVKKSSSFLVFPLKGEGKGASITFHLHVQLKRVVIVKSERRPTEGSGR